MSSIDNSVAKAKQDPASESVLRTPLAHLLKTDPQVFDDVQSGAKTHEIRYDDRGYQEGDELVLHRTGQTGAEMANDNAPLLYTGETLRRTISHIQRGYGLLPGWCILSFERATPGASSLRDLLNEIRCTFTTDDGLPDNLLPRIDAALEEPDELDCAEQILESLSVHLDIPTHYECLGDYIIAVVAAVRARAEPKSGDWIRAEDVDRLAKQLDRASNFGGTTTDKPALCDVVSHACQRFAQADEVILATSGLSHAMGSPAVAASFPRSITSETIRLAMQRYSTLNAQARSLLPLAVKMVERVPAAGEDLRPEIQHLLNAITVLQDLTVKV